MWHTLFAIWNLSLSFRSICLNKYPSAAINRVPSWKVKRGETLMLLHCILWLCTLWGCLRMLMCNEKTMMQRVGSFSLWSLMGSLFTNSLVVSWTIWKPLVKQEWDLIMEKNENSNWKYVEPDLTFISCLSPWCFFWR